MAVGGGVGSGGSMPLRPPHVYGPLNGHVYAIVFSRFLSCAIFDRARVWDLLKGEQVCARYCRIRCVASP